MADISDAMAAATPWSVGTNTFFQDDLHLFRWTFKRTSLTSLGMVGMTEYKYNDIRHWPVLEITKQKRKK